MIYMISHYNKIEQLNKTIHWLHAKLHIIIRNMMKLSYCRLISDGST